MIILFIVGMSRMDSIPSIVDIPTMLLLSDLCRKFHIIVENKIIANIFFIKKFDRSQHFKRKQLFIVVRNKKNID